MDGEGIGHLVAVDAEGECGQADDGFAFGPCFLAALAGDISGVEVVLAFGEVSIMSFDGGSWEDSYFVFALADSMKVGGCNIPFVDFTFVVGHVILSLEIMFKRPFLYPQKQVLARANTGPWFFTGNLQLFGR